MKAADGSFVCAIALFDDGTIAKNTGRTQTNKREVCLKSTYPEAEEAVLPAHDTTHIVQMPRLAVIDFASGLKKDGCWLADARLLKIAADIHLHSKS